MAKSIKPWIAAARLRTLPLALSGIILGSLLAKADGNGSWVIFGLCVVTATLFQILSNFANDLGDGIKGTDALREGEARMVGSGVLTASSMKRVVATTSIIALLSSTALIWMALERMEGYLILTFTGLAILSVLAALGYTLGKRPYGYMRLGEVMVFFFFGWVAVAGTYTITTGTFNPHVLWAASAVGLLASGVLNLNNLRDINSDLKSGKKTVANALGFRYARVYHYILIILALDCVFVYNWMSNTGWTRNLFVLAIPALLLHMLKVSKLRKPIEADPLLKDLALSTLALSVLMGLGHII